MLFFMALPAFCDADIDERRKELESIRNEIEKNRSEIGKLSSKEANLMKLLKRIDNDIALITRYMKKLDDQEETREITITVKPKPQAPDELDVRGWLSDGFELVWLDNSDNETGFYLYNADTNELLAKFDQNTESGKVNKLNCATTYRLYLVAVNTVNESLPSNIVVEETGACP